MPGPGGVWSAASWTWRVPPKKVPPNAQNPTKIGPKNPQNGPKMSILTIIPSLATFPPKPSAHCVFAFWHLHFFRSSPTTQAGPNFQRTPGLAGKKCRLGPLWLKKTPVLHDPCLESTPELIRSQNGQPDQASLQQNV